MAAALPAPAAGGGVPVSESMLQGELLVCEVQEWGEVYFAENSSTFVVCTSLNSLAVAFLMVDSVLSDMFDDGLFLCVWLSSPGPSVCSSS